MGGHFGFFFCFGASWKQFRVKPRFSIVYDAIKAGSSGLQSIDPFEDISPLVTEHDESESLLLPTIDQLTDELRENFVNVRFDEENSEWKQSDIKDDVDSERNIFDDIITDDEWIDNPDSTL